MKWPWRGPAISKHFDTAIIKKTITAVSVAMVFVSFSSPALADQFDAQIAAARAAANSAQTQANAAQGQANTYQAQLNQYSAQVAAIQAQIYLSQAQFNQISAQITDAEAKLAENKTVLAANIKQMYLDSGITPLEMLASSQNISDFMNKQQYQDKVQAKVQDAMSSIIALRKQLDGQKVQVSDILTAQQTQRTQVAALQQQSANLLATAQQNASAADQQVQHANAQISSLRNAQAASFARLYSNGGSPSGGAYGGLVYKNVQFGGACGGGYPGSVSGPNGVWGCDYSTDYNYPNFFDNWGLANRECVSYTAWAMADRGGNVPNFGGHGNAYEWPDTLRGRYREDSDPSGARVVAIIPRSMIGGVGHSMVVENGGAINNGYIHVSQYNWWPSENGPTGLFSTMDVKTTGLIFIHF